MARTRTHVLVTGLIVVLLATTAGFALLRGENDRASSLAAPPDAREHRRVSPLPLTPPTTVPAPPPPPAPVAAPAPPPAPTFEAAPAPTPEPEPEPPATTVLSGAAGRLVGLINGVRSGLGLAPYAVDGELTASAQRWAQSMAAAGAMSHQGDLSVGISAPWVRLGENVGVGDDVVVVHDTMLASPGHYGNIADAGFGSIGVAVVESGGVLYVAEEFMQL